MRIAQRASPQYCKYIFLDFIDPEQIKNLYNIGVGPKSECDTINNKYKKIDFYGVEANPAMYEAVRDTFPGKILQAAVSEAGRGNFADFFIHEPIEMASGLVPHSYEIGEGAPEPLKVPAMNLDEFDEEVGRQEGVILWMDIEGYELNALKSGPNLLA